MLEFYIKGDKKTGISVYNPSIGFRRALTAAEWRIIKLQDPKTNYVTVPQADYDSLKVGALALAVVG